MTRKTIDQKIATKEAELARLNARAKAIDDARLILLGRVADTLLNDAVFSAALVNAARTQLSAAQFKQLRLVDEVASTQTNAASVYY